jgi:PPP family 3-phenylpropionic acid transporter
MGDKARNSLLHVGVLYATLSIYTGVRQPYWGMWLVSAGGLSQQTAGAMATVYLVFESVAGIVSGILLSNVAIRRRVVTTCYLALAAATALFFVAGKGGVAAYLALSIVAGFFFGCIYHAREVFWLEFCQAHQHPYSTVRIWASCTFMASALAAGVILSHAPLDALLVLILFAVATGLLWFRFKVRPEPEDAAAESGGAAATHRAAPLLSLAVLRRLGDLGAIYFTIVPITGLLHSSQALFHLFSAMHFGALGIGNDWVGIYWAVALISEAAVFTAGQKIINRWGPWTLLILSAALTIVRWSGMAVVTDRYALLAVQLIHGFASAGAPLAAGTLLIKIVPRQHLSIAQGFLQVSMNACMGVMLMVSGFAYGMLGANAFLLMAAAGVPAMMLGVYMSLSLRRQQRRPATT